LQKKSSEEISHPHLQKLLAANAFKSEEIQFPMENCKGWQETLESAAIDTFRNVVDAQIVLCDALKKANKLGDLVHARISTEELIEHAQITNT